MPGDPAEASPSLVAAVSYAGEMTSDSDDALSWEGDDSAERRPRDAARRTTPAPEPTPAEAVTPEGFEIVFRTWGETRVARVRARRLAIGPAEHVDEFEPD